MSLNQKKKNIYIKNIYISKNSKLNNSININFESKKTISDYNVNKKDSSTTTKQFPKKSVKPVYQNIQKNKCLIKGNQNFLSTKNIHIKSPKKEILEQQNIYETNDINSGRKSGNKKYDINNLFKERSNSESSFNLFNRTYTTFNNNNNNTNKENNQNGKNNNINGNSNININNKENIKKNNNIDNKINYSYVTLTSKNSNELKINLNNINFNKNIYNIKNTIKTNKKPYNSNNNISENSCLKKSATNTSISRKGSKKYIYKEQPQKKATNPKLYFSPHQNIDLNLDKEKEKEKFKDKDNNLNNTETISTEINLLSPNPPSSSKENLHEFNSLKNPKRIQKYILSDKKRKTSSRQNYREYKYKEAKDNKDIKEGKSRSICPEPKKHLNSPKKNNNNISNILENKIIKKKSNVEIYSENGRLLHKSKNINNNNLELIQRYYYEKDSSCDGITGYNYNKNMLFEQSAIIIQSVFRGYLVKNKFETNLCNYNNYNKAVEILENLFYDKSKTIFFQNFLTLTKTKNIKSYKSCKTFKLINIPTSPFTESEGYSFPNKFIDLYLHKEIGERFNIIKQNSDREKELEKKHKEELEIILNKNKELFKDNKKKEKIIGIITGDNQNIAKKLKELKELKSNINNLKIENPNEFYIYPDTIHPKYLNKFISIQDVLNAYKKLILFFLIKKKDTFNKEQIKKYFYKYKNIVTIDKYENIINTNIKTQKLNDIIIKNENKKILQKQNYFDKLYYITLLNKKEIESRNDIIKTKLKNLIIKKEKITKIYLKQYLNKFHTKIIISRLIEENTKLLENKKNEKLSYLKKIIISLDSQNKKNKLIQYKNVFTKWYLISKILSMKAVTDEKKRKKRQKQRTKRKIEKNKSMNKLFISTSLSQSQTGNLDKNSISTSYKEKTFAKKKENKDNFNYLEHTVTTDLSMAETNNENKGDKILKGTEKLNELFIKATVFYKLFGNKSNEVNLCINKENPNIKNNNIKDKKEIKAENESDNDEDSGESSFGL